MIISEQQVRLALEYLHTQTKTQPEERSASADTISPEFVERVRRELADAPETRGDRVAMGREFLAADDVSSDQVAEKMIGRIISDTIR